MSLGEFELISRYFLSGDMSHDSFDKNSGFDKNTIVKPHLDIGIGDDAAVLSGLGNHKLAVSTDTLVESVHFPVDADPELLAQRALRINLSDMAAMGAKPQWFTLALTLPEIKESWLQGFSKGLHECAAEFGCQLIGGDTTKGPLNIGIQIIGTIPENRAVLARSGVKAGDLLLVSGTLGDAGAALGLDLQSFDLKQPVANAESFLMSRYWLPTPRLNFAIETSDYINAACDISDGLLADAGHLCEQSNLSAIIDLEKIPVSSELFNHDSQAKLNALTTGDDYELCMAVPQEHLGQLQAIASAQSVQVTVIGHFENSLDVENQRVHVLGSQGQTLEINKAGYTHF